MLPDRKGTDFRDYTLFPLAAKSSPEERTWLPVWAHLLDTAGVMSHLVRHWVPACVVQGWADQTSPAEVEKFCTFVALVHDMGKLTPVFQAKITAQIPELREHIAKAGIEIPPYDRFFDPHASLHAYAGEAILLHLGCPKGLAAVVGSHHGIPFAGGEDPEEQMSYYEENFYGKKGIKSPQGTEWEKFGTNGSPLRWLTAGIRPRRGCRK